MINSKPTKLMKLRIILLCLLFGFFLVTSCDVEDNNVVQQSQKINKINLLPNVDITSKFDITTNPINARQVVSQGNGEQVALFSQALKELSDQLLEVRPNVKLVKAEFMSDRTDGLTIFADDRTLDLTSRWVPNDARRTGDDDINHVVFQPLAIANGSINAEPAIDASMETWNNNVDCNNVTIIKNGDTGVFPSAILLFNGQPGDPSTADINTVGFLPGFIFDAVLGPGASASVLGVTFTFIFINPGNGTPTDVDGNGKNDTAFKEIWYNDFFLWTNSGGPGIDIESVAVHENGHALEKAHIGVGFFDPRTGAFGFNPRAIMNAGYIGPFSDPAPLDDKSHCLVFGTWPFK